MKKEYITPNVNVVFFAAMANLLQESSETPELPETIEVIIGGKP